MKSIKLSSILMLVILSFAGTAQKVKLKDLDVKAKFLRLPDVGFPEGTNTYGIDLVVDENMMSYVGYTASNLKNSIVIPGYVKVEEFVGGIVEVQFNIPTAQPRELVKNAKKSKDGKTWTEYKYTNKIDQTILIKVLNKERQLIKDYIVKYSKVVGTSTFRSIKKLGADYKKNSSNLIKSGRSDAVQSVLSQLNAYLRDDFGIVERNVKVEFKTLKKKKHPETPKYTKIAKTVEDAYGKMTYNEDLSEFITAIQPAIDFWVSSEPTYDVTDKHQKKLKFACRYNTALAYLWAEDFENAKKYATEILSGDYKEKRGKKLLKVIDKTKTKIENNFRKTRHFKLSQSKEETEAISVKKEERAAKIATGDIKAFDDFNMKMDVGPTTIVADATMYLMGGNTNKGYFSFESKDGIRPDFRYPKRNIFGFLKGSSIKTGTLNYSELDSIQIGDIMYRVRDISTGTGMLSMNLKNAVVETIVDYKRTTLELVHPPFAKAKAVFGGEPQLLEPDLVVWHKENGKYMLTSGLLGSNKAMKKIVKDCPAALTYLEEKKKEKSGDSIFKRMNNMNNRDPLAMVLEIYDSCK